MKDLNEIRTFFLDVEKTLTRWNDTVIGAEDLVMSLRESGKKVRFHTDNSILSREKYAEKLTKMNIKASKEDILTSAYATAQMLAEKDVRDAYIIGEEGLIRELEEQDINFSEEAETVVVGLDRQFSYNKLKRAKKILNEGGEMYFCSNEDIFRKKTGDQPHQGAYNRALKTFGSGELTGKPSEAFRNAFKDYFTYYPDNSVMIGDRLADIETGNRLGMTTAAVLTGEISEDRLKVADEIERPDYAISSLSKLRRRVL